LLDVPGFLQFSVQDRIQVFLGERLKLLLALDAAEDVLHRQRLVG